VFNHCSRCLEVLYESSLPRNPQISTNFKIWTPLEALEFWDGWNEEAMGKAKERGGETHQEIKGSAFAGLREPSCPHTTRKVLCRTIVVTGRKIFSPLLFCSHAKSPGLDSDEECDLEETLSAVPGDAESAEEGTDEGEQKQGVLESTLESHTPNAEASLPMSEDVDNVDMIEAPAAVNQESTLEHGKDDSVSPRYVKFRPLY
jgi:hypothetical protein